MLPSSRCRRHARPTARGPRPKQAKRTAGRPFPDYRSARQSARPYPGDVVTAPGGANPVAGRQQRRFNDARKPDTSENEMRAGSIIACLVALLAIAASPSVQAQTKVRVGQPQAGTFQFVPLQVGTEAGIFHKHGIELEVISFGGG